MRAVAILALLSILLSTGCAQVLGNMRRAWRQPGERLVDLPDRVAQQYACDERTLPFFLLESHELNPVRVRPGTEFNHHLEYILCPASPTEVVTGRLTTRIRYRGKSQVIEEIPRYELKPGRWVVDAFILLPEDAEAGVYALELVFDSKSIRFKKSITFGVERP